ncbi:uncharacterized protein Z519_02739 [Cladophialophora bantiana CBS 173.52]|uniref:Uncharacterized protein n=1 Tax=Cladophialophora bantiana (strain ATCC 10958 / CBS 173.52 / CDC B-1940 / NIH 8579) TaxID=1442370 RepID=A0A0D2GG44_CLAB1|nr:uncharacterized protein Z519_02739 [Cladophialophora bantiana CBS 173.52]KIW97347.1 hypothetical protein Z519_02739 [Cladophialophora bantiana CBS 173.52]
MHHQRDPMMAYLQEENESRNEGLRSHRNMQLVFIICRGTSGSDEKISATKIQPLDSEVKANLPHDQSSGGAAGHKSKHQSESD